MDHVIKGKNTAPVLKLTLAPNEYVIAMPERLIATGGDIRIAGLQKPGLLRNLADKFKGKTLSLNTIHAEDESAWIWLSTPLHCGLATIDMYASTTRQSEIFLREDCFLAADSHIRMELATHRDVKPISDILSTEILVANGSGPLFVTGYGAVEQILLQPHQDICIDSAHLVAWDSSVTCTQVKSGGLLSSGPTRIWGENKTLFQLQGNGSVWVQTRIMPAKSDD